MTERTLSRVVLDCVMKEKVMRMGTIAAAMIVVGVAVSGCGLRVGTWETPGASRADFNLDRYNCQHDALTEPFGDNPLVAGPRQRDCMVAHGWTLVGDGSGYSMLN